MILPVFIRILTLFNQQVVAKQAHSENGPHGGGGGGGGNGGHYSGQQGMYGGAPYGRTSSYNSGYRGSQMSSGGYDQRNKGPNYG